MRGKGPRPFFEDMETRITPAYAGKSSTVFRSYLGIKDHPRLCGEKVTVAVPLIPYSGSPPPMRGKGSNYMQESDVTGITPAYAGKRRNREAGCKVR